MNANKQDAGGLPNEMGFEQWYAMNAFDYPNNPIGCRDCSIARKAWHAALEAARDGELCRAAPAGGVRVDGEMFICYLIDKCERETISEESLHEWLADFLKNPRYHKPVSAPAGSGEVEEVLKKCDSVLNDMRPISPCLTEQMEEYFAEIRALLRKLQQGAE